MHSSREAGYQNEHRIALLGAKIWPAALNKRSHLALAARAVTFMDICHVVDDALPLGTDKLAVPFTGGDTPVEVVTD